MRATLHCLMVVVVLLGTCTLAACGSKINDANYEKVNVGMTPEQVTAILGEPTKKEGLSGAVGPISVDAPTHIWESGDKKITVQFADNKVLAKTKSGF